MRSFRLIWPVIGLVPAALWAQAAADTGKDASTKAGANPAATAPAVAKPAATAPPAADAAVAKPAATAPPAAPAATAPAVTRSATTAPPAADAAVAKPAATAPAAAPAASAPAVTKPAATAPAAATAQADNRPFGKYLVEILNLSPDGTNTVRFPASASDRLLPQTITLRLAPCPSAAAPAPGAAAGPLARGATFCVQATSDSKPTVAQIAVSGAEAVPASPAAAPPLPAGTQQYKQKGNGPVVIRATEAGDAHYAPATPVVLILQVADPPASTPAKPDPDCAGLGLAAPSPDSTPIDLPGIVSLIGNPTPFQLVPQGDNAIFIYASRLPTSKERDELLPQIEAQIAELAPRTAKSLGVTLTPKPFSVELDIAHSAALGDPATRISGLNYSGFTVQDVGSGRVRIKASSPPKCADWKAFLTAIRNMQWQVAPEPFQMKLYYLSSTDAATAFTALAGASGGSAGSTPAAATGSAASGSSASASGSAAGSGTAGGASGAATVSINQPPGSVIELKSDTTPCVVAGLTLANGSACAPASASASSAAAASPASSGGAAAAASAPKPPAMASMGVAAGTGEQNPSDLLVFSDANPGDDAEVRERKRILAQLDLPRPEMVINAWVMQNSTVNPRAMGVFTNTVRDLVAGYNDALELVVLGGWASVKRQTGDPAYFDRDFYNYIAGQYLADTYVESTATDSQALAQNFLSTSPAHLADDPEKRTDKFGICPADRYCLGYTTLFQPLKPRLTDFLLTLIAAADPLGRTETAIQAVEGNRNPVETERGCMTAAAGVPREAQDRCRAIWNDLGLSRQAQASDAGCAAADYRNILGSLTHPESGGQPRRSPRIYLACFQAAARTYMPHAGLLRSAIADFLFHYKMSQQYPHEFAPYELSQSANGLKSTLSPLIDAFNRDILAFQTFMRADVQYQVDRLNHEGDQRCCVKRLFGLDKPSFFNDGLVTVRTISGQPTTVGTTSQSVLDVSTAPTLSNLLSGIGSPASGAGANASPLASVLKTGQPDVALLAGVLNAYQTASAQFGRQLQLTVVPRSLSTASSAEITVTLNADETAGGSVYSGGPPGGTPPNTSRVASHDISTRIRVESVKLFEVSSFSAIVQRSRSRFPLIPPFVEIPYIGTLAGIPIPGAREYHGSTAVMSAMVVPTAADIAYGLRFVPDQVVDGDPGKCSYIKDSAGQDVKNACRFRRAVSLLDLNRQPIGNFHRSMINCFATDMTSPYPGSAALRNIADQSACKALSFDAVPRSAY